MENTKIKKINKMRHFESFTNIVRPSSLFFKVIIKTFALKTSESMETDFLTRFIHRQSPPSNKHFDVFALILHAPLPR